MFIKASIDGWKVSQTITDMEIIAQTNVHRFFRSEKEATKTYLRAMVREGILNFIFIAIDHTD
jgi:hypothetical protein